jgi:hypothetical protein
MARAEGKSNRFISGKERDIEREGRKMGDIDGRIGKETASKQKVEGEFDGLVEGVTDPALLAIIAKSRTEKVGINDGRLSELSTKKAEAVKKQEAYNADIEVFKKKIGDLENTFATKVDGRIERIKARDYYEGNVAFVKDADVEIKKIEEEMSVKEKQLAQYEKTWEQRKILGKEGKKELREKMGQLRDELNRTQGILDDSIRRKEKYAKQIAKTDKRVASLEKFKGKYVGKKEEGVETSEAQVTETAPEISDAQQDEDQQESIGASGGDEAVGGEASTEEGDVEVEEGKKIYENPDEDPAVKEVAEETSRLIAVFTKQLPPKNDFDLKRNQFLASSRALLSFVNKYPQKAEAYASKRPDIKGAFETYKINKENHSRGELVRKCENFEELYKVIDRFGEIKGSMKKYKSEEVKQIIERARNNTLGDIEILTDTYGIRTKVMELFSKQVK